MGISLKQKALTYVYFVPVLVALVAMLISSANYAELYNAINKFRVTISDFDCNIDQVNDIIEIVMNVTLVHNSSFSGFSLHSLIFELHYNNTAIPLLETVIWFDKEAVAPFSNTTKRYDTDVYAQNEPTAQEFLDFCQQSEEIFWTFSSIIRVYVFEGDSIVEITPPLFSFSTESPA